MTLLIRRLLFCAVMPVQLIVWLVVSIPFGVVALIDFIQDGELLFDLRGAYTDVTLEWPCSELR